MQFTPNYHLKKPGGADIVDVNDLNANADILEEALTPVADPEQKPASNGPAKLSQWISWITNRIKAITGKPNWFDAPDTTLADIVTTAAPGKVLKLDSEGKLPASITGDADTLDGMHAADFAPVNHAHLSPISVRTGTIPDQGTVTPTPGYANHKYFVSLNSINTYDASFDIPLEQNTVYQYTYPYATPYAYYYENAIDTTRVGYICTIDANLKVTARVLADNNVWVSGTANYMEIAWN